MMSSSETSSALPSSKSSPSLCPARSSLESSPARPTLDGRMPSAPHHPQLQDAGRPLLRRLGSTAGGLFKPPTLEHLAGRWHITHSTLPIWRDKRNVTITYIITSSDSGARLDDTVEYQEMDSSKVKSVKGVDTISKDANDTSKWHWRGKGIIKIASAQWEILGWGIDGESDAGSANGHGLGSRNVQLGDLAEERQWMVTYFAKTAFTPAGMDVYSRHPNGLTQRLTGGIREALVELDNPQLRELARKLYEVRRDGARAL